MRSGYGTMGMGNQPRAWTVGRYWLSLTLCGYINKGNRLKNEGQR